MKFWMNQTTDYKDWNTAEGKKEQAFKQMCIKAPEPLWSV